MNYNKKTLILTFLAIASCNSIVSADQTLNIKSSRDDLGIYNSEMNISSNSYLANTLVTLSTRAASLVANNFFTFTVMGALATGAIFLRRWWTRKKEDTGLRMRMDSVEAKERLIEEKRINLIRKIRRLRSTAHELRTIEDRLS